MIEPCIEKPKFRGHNVHKFEDTCSMKDTLGKMEERKKKARTTKNASAEHTIIQA